MTERVLAINDRKQERNTCTLAVSSGQEFPLLAWVVFPLGQVLNASVGFVFVSFSTVSAVRHRNRLPLWLAVPILPGTWYTYRCYLYGTANVDSLSLCHPMALWFLFRYTTTGVGIVRR